jgi:CBS domain-containing protein
MIESASITLTEQSSVRPIERVITVSEVMTAPVIAVTPDDLLSDAWGLLLRSRLRHLVVLDGARCVAILDDRRIMAEWPIGPFGPHRTTVGALAGPRVRWLLAHTSLQDAAAAMIQERTDALPIVRDDGDVVGIVTVTDILKCISTAHFMSGTPDNAADGQLLEGPHPA